MTEKYCSFVVGQHVVCVDDMHYRPSSFKEKIPQRGMVYTVRWVGIVFGEPHVLLHEIVNAPQEYADGFVEAKFLARRFRPAPSIDALASLLRSSPVPERFE